MVAQTLYELFTALGAILTAVGLSVGVAYVFFIWLGKSWIEQKFKQQIELMKHQQQKEVETLRQAINTQFSRISKVHTKEFEVLPETWKLMHEAYGAAIHLVRSLKSIPEFASMQVAEFSQFVSETTLSPAAKKKFLVAHDRPKFYLNEVYWSDLQKAEDTGRAFNNYIIVNSVFMTRDLQEKFKSLNKSMQEAIFNYRIGKELELPDNLSDARKVLSNLDDQLSKLQDAVQKRLRYEEA